MPWGRVVDSGCGLGCRGVFHAHPRVRVARCGSADCQIVAGVGGPVLAHVLAFAITAGVALLIVRPIARRQISHPALVREGSYALVGKKAVVIEKVTAMQGLKGFRGVWSARALDEDQVIPVGTPVDVMEIDGATAIVYPRELLPERTWLRRRWRRYGSEPFST